MIGEHNEAPRTEPTTSTTHQQTQPDQATAVCNIRSSGESFSFIDDDYHIDSDLDPDATVSPPRPRLITENTIGSTDSLLLEMELQDLRDRQLSVHN